MDTDQILTTPEHPSSAERFFGIDLQTPKDPKDVAPPQPQYTDARGLAVAFYSKVSGRKLENVDAKGVIFTQE